MLDTAKIKQLRERQKLTMEQAAIAAGLKSRQHWFRIEGGGQTNLELETLGRIAKALKCDAKDLLR